MDVKATIGECEVLAQLAEETAELTQAALKLRRVLDKTNPTPVTEAAARESVIEEIADVLLCVNTLVGNGDQVWKNIQTIMDVKNTRWEARLHDEGKNAENCAETQ